MPRKKKNKKVTRKTKKKMKGGTLTEEQKSMATLYRIRKPEIEREMEKYPFLEFLMDVHPQQMETLKKEYNQLIADRIISDKEIPEHDKPRIETAIKHVIDPKIEPEEEVKPDIDTKVKSKNKSLLPYTELWLPRHLQPYIPQGSSRPTLRLKVHKNNVKPAYLLPYPFIFTFKNSTDIVLGFQRTDIRGMSYGPFFRIKPGESEIITPELGAHAHARANSEQDWSIMLITPDKKNIRDYEHIDLEIKLEKKYGTNPIYELFDIPPDEIPDDY